MQAFVTGATGFVGAAVVRELLSHGVAVRALVRPGSPRQNVEGLDIEIVEGDLREAGALPDLIAGCELLFHVAAYYATREEDARAMYEINIGGTKNLFTAACHAGVRKAVYTSTIGTIGQSVDGSLPNEDTEFNLWETCSHYVKSKYLAEMVALLMERRGLQVVVVNPAAPLGQRDIKPTSTGQRVIACLEGRVPSFVPGGINFVAVQDVARGHWLAAERGRPGRRYLLGNKEGNLTAEDFMELMEKVSGVRVARPRRRNPLHRARQWLRPAPHPQGARPAALVCDPSRAIRELGLPQTPLEAALREEIAWFRAHGYVGSSLREPEGVAAS